MKVLVTGGLGYIGSHTVVTLLESGYDVVIVDDLSNTRREVLERIKKISGRSPVFYQFDLCKQEELQACLSSESGIDGVIHFAARIYVSESMQDPLLYYRNNLLSLINVLQAMHDFHIPHLVFSSSCTVYGDNPNSPIKESEPVIPAASAYGNTKQIAEEIIRDAVSAKQKLNAISLRYFNPVGAHPSAEIGELSMHVQEHILPNLIRSVLQGENKQFNVFGNDYDTPDGTAVRDYIHVMDLARAHKAALEMLSESGKAEYRHYNIGTGKGTSVLEMLKTFEAVTGRAINYKIAPRRTGDVEKIWADPGLAEKELGWKAEYKLESMISSHWNWEKYRMNSYSGSKPGEVD